MAADCVLRLVFSHLYCGPAGRDLPLILQGGQWLQFVTFADFLDPERVTGAYVLIPWCIGFKDDPGAPLTSLQDKWRIFFRVYAGATLVLSMRHAGMGISAAIGIDAGTPNIPAEFHVDLVI